ncbi:hypothetical protein K488DRAFT_47005 [Vararia minispora EC-137]|uniref:Uncharacterized protein n=1 Tax=Vararia minispora EC-137 TaxID=1314806 RepID=A0ACB8QQC1_9AGAM|nr:hypothetical protein K488DRAFT_47005 [Vararia minispora EC-137]
MTSQLQGLPVELITAILEELDLPSLITVASLSSRLRSVASDPYLNPWRKPIVRALNHDTCEGCTEQLAALQHLSERSIVPRQNWIEVLTLASPSFILLDATLPNMQQADWETCFKRRFLPGWVKWKRDHSWREAYKRRSMTCCRTLTRVWHRSQTSCTAEEAWTKYITLNKNGSANELEVSSRSFNPLNIFNDMKIQSNLAHLETHVRLVVVFADVRILAFGVLNKPRGTFTINKNARYFLHPPGIERDASAHEFERLSSPLPALSHRNYPFYTPGGEDKRWLGDGAVEENGRQWVGPMMLTAQIIGPHTRTHFMDGPAFQDLDLTSGPGRGQYASFTWTDLDVIAPWMKELITKRVDGLGLGN